MIHRRLLEDLIRVAAADPCLNIVWADIIFTVHKFERRYSVLFNSV